jgi:hypothetical protein
LGGRGRQISEFKDSLVYRVSSRTARAIQRNPVSKKQRERERERERGKERKGKERKGKKRNVFCPYRNTMVHGKQTFKYFPIVTSQHVRIKLVCLFIALCYRSLILKSAVWVADSDFKTC